MNSSLAEIADLFTFAEVTLTQYSTVAGHLPGVTVDNTKVTCKTGGEIEDHEVPRQEPDDVTINLAEEVIDDQLCIHMTVLREQYQWRQAFRGTDCAWRLRPRRGAQLDEVCNYLRRALRIRLDEIQLVNGKNQITGEEVYRDCVTTLLVRRQP